MILARVLYYFVDGAFLLVTAVQPNLMVSTSRAVVFPVKRSTVNQHTILRSRHTVPSGLPPTLQGWLS